MLQNLAGHMLSVFAGVMSSRRDWLQQEHNHAYGGASLCKFLKVFANFCKHLLTFLQRINFILLQHLLYFICCYRL